MKSIIALLLLAAYTYATPYGNYGTSGRLVNDGVLECHGITCPSGSVACAKTVVTSSDKKTLLSTIKCEDVQGHVLHTVTKSSENPFTNVQVQSFSYTGSYNFGLGEGGLNVNRHSNSIPTINTNRNRDTYHVNDLEDQIETFDK